MRFSRFLFSFAVFMTVIAAFPRARAADLPLMRRWVVFPFDTDPALKSAAESAWWKCREKIANTKKYLIASRQFLVLKDAFQPRKDLGPADVKLLAHLLDADVIVTGYSQHREFKLNVYLAQNGALFWSKHMSFHPSLRAADQLELISDKLTQELLSEMPYQGFTVVDPLIGKVVYEESGKQYAVIDLGDTSGLTGGTPIQWVNVIVPDEPENGPALADSKIAVVGEGVISKVKQGVVVAQLQRAQGPDAIREKTLVRIPRIAEKAEAEFANAIPGREHLAPELVPTNISPVTPESHGTRRTSMIFGSVIGIAGILLLAF